jgi:hypothetical protein
VKWVAALIPSLTRSIVGGTQAAWTGTVRFSERVPDTESHLYHGLKVSDLSENRSIAIYRPNIDRNPEVKEPFSERELPGLSLQVMTNIEKLDGLRFVLGQLYQQILGRYLNRRITDEGMRE